MKKLVVYPSDPMQAYLDLGQTYEQFEDYFNPQGYFDEVYAISPWGNQKEEKHGKITYIKAKPKDFGKLIKRIMPDVVRAYGGYHCSDWLAISQTQGIPTIVSVHDTNPCLIFDSIRYADNVVCMAQCVQDAVRAKVDCSGKGEYVMPNRIDVDLFANTRDDELFEQLSQHFGRGRHILHVGRKSEQKNLDTLINSLPFLPEDVSVIFVGRGDFLPYEKLAKEKGVQNRVFNVDHVANVDLPKWYSWCDCFCTPSRWEGFGIVFIEAASCNAAIVTSDIGPMNEYLTNNRDSILVKDYENPKSIAEAIMKVLDYSVDVEHLKEAAREVGERFAKKKVDEQEISIYKEIIEKGVKSRVEVPFIEKRRLEWKYRKYNK